eukprot:3501922-Lingulodinium_polyedra.AAC.1
MEVSPAPRWLNAAGGRQIHVSLPHHAPRPNNSKQNNGDHDGNAEHLAREHAELPVGERVLANPGKNTVAL